MTMTFSSSTENADEKNRGQRSTNRIMRMYFQKIQNVDQESVGRDCDAAAADAVDDDDALDSV